MLWRLTWKRNGKVIDMAEMHGDSILDVLGKPQISENKRVLRQQATEFHAEPVLPVPRDGLRLAETRVYEFKDGSPELVGKTVYEHEPEGEPATVTPLFGSKTHPMKPETRDLLRTLLKGPQPANQFNPGVLNRWQRGGYIEYLQLPSPYPSNRGARIAHVEITMPGRAQLRPANYSELASSDQWKIDKQLGLLDWEGSQ